MDPTTNDIIMITINNSNRIPFVIPWYVIIVDFQIPIKSSVISLQIILLENVIPHSPFYIQLKYIVCNNDLYVLSKRTIQSLQLRQYILTAGQIQTYVHMKLIFHI